MGLQNIYLLSGFFFCLIAATMAYSLIKRRHNNFAHAEIIVLTPILLAAVGYVGLDWNNSDFISAISCSAFLAPLGAAFVLFLVSFKLSKLWQNALIIFGLASLILVGLNLPTSLDKDLPPVINQLCVAAVWTFFCLSLRISNSSSGFVGLHIFCPMVGVIALFIISAAPFALGFEAACVAGAILGFLLFNWPPAIFKLSDKGADVLGFISGGILIYTGMESSFSSVLILAMLPLCEAGLSFFIGLIFASKRQNLNLNTASAMAASSGLEPSIIAKHIFRINLLMILFGCFQVYAPNNFSIPLVCAVIVFWQMYRLAHWNNLSSGLAETNRTVIAEFKQSFSDVKKYLTKITSQPSDKADKKD